MTGYVPLFDSLTKGTLCGKWPDIGLWPIVLSMADKNGVIDATPTYIAQVTGLEIQDVVACMSRFCEPDPSSRSREHEGRRLVPLDAGRDWGWQIVNHGMYREKARLMAQNAAQVADGRNAEKVRRYKERHRETPAGHPQTPNDTLSNANANADLREEKKKTKRERALRASRVPPDFVPDLSLASSALPNVDAEAEAQKFRDWEFKTPRSDWAAAWRNWVQRCKETGQYAKKRINGEWL